MTWIKHDLTNQRFGKLIALEPIKKDRYGWIWKCQCDCGKITECNAARLRGNRKHSCGCNLYGEGHYMWSGHKEITGFYWRRILERAKSRQLDITVSIQDAWEQFERQNRKCALTGVPLYFTKHLTRVFGKGTQLPTASFDRIDSNKGYIKGNIQWVHKDINVMKMDMTENDLIYWARKISEYSKDKKVDEPTSERKRWKNRYEKNTEAN